MLNDIKISAIGNIKNPNIIIKLKKLDLFSKYNNLNKIGHVNKYKTIVKEIIPAPNNVEVLAPSPFIA
jgi:hypothetical protein